MRRLSIIIATLSLAVLATGAHGRVSAAVATPPDSFVLALDTGAFPTSAALVHTHVDTTAATVDAEGMLGDKSANGDLYQRLKFEGSLFESAHLPHFKGAVRSLWLMATVFPSVRSARRAFALDSRTLSCDSSPLVPIQMLEFTCAYASTDTSESGMYVVATSGPVEFIALGFVGAVSLAARFRANRDTTYLAEQEAGHVGHVLATGQFDPLRAPAPIVLTDTSHVLCQFTSIATAFPGWLAQEQPMILHTVGDLNAHSVVGNAGKVFPADGFQRGCLQLFDLPSVQGAHHGMSVETDVFASTAGAEHAYRWWSGVEAWVTPPTQLLRVNAFGTPSLALSYTDSTYFHNTSALVFIRYANVLVGLRSWTDGTNPVVVAQTESDALRAAPLVASILAQLRGS